MHIFYSIGEKFGEVMGVFHWMLAVEASDVRPVSSALWLSVALL